MFYCVFVFVFVVLMELVLTVINTKLNSYREYFNYLELSLLQYFVTWEILWIENADKNINKNKKQFQHNNSHGINLS